MSLSKRLRGVSVMLLSLLVVCTLAAPASAASNSGVTYHGRILKADGTPLDGTSVQFKLQIRSPGNESCLLYEEVQTLNMSNTSGVFSISLNDGSGIRDDSSGVQFGNIFSNRSGYTLPAGSCAAGSTYVPNSNDSRSFVVSFKDESMQAFESLPAQPVNFTPTALQALQIAGFGPNNLLRVDDATAVANTTPLNNAQYNALMAVANGTAPYVSSSLTGGAILPTLTTAPSAPVSGAIWYNSGTNSLQFYNGSTTQSLGTSSASGTVTSVGTGTGLTGGPISATGTISLATFGTAGTYYKVVTDSTGRVASGSAALAETDLPNIVTAGKVSGAAMTSGTVGGTTAINTSGNIVTSGLVQGGSMSTNTLSANAIRLFNSGNTFKATLTVPALTADYNLVFPMTAGSSGNVLSTDGSGNLSWIAPASASLSSGQSGILPIANGGTGTATGSITGSGALTFAAGGSNQNITLTPSGTGYTLLGGNVGIGTSVPTNPLDIEVNSTDSAGAVSAATTHVTVTAASDTALTPAVFFGDTILQGAGNFTGSVASMTARTLFYGSSTATSLNGISSIVQNRSTGTVTAASGLYTKVSNSATGTMTNGYGLYVDAPANTIGNYFSIFSNGGKSYFAGNVGIGTSSPVVNLQVMASGAQPAIAIGNSDTGSYGGSLNFTSNFTTLANASKMTSVITGTPDTSTGGKISFSTAQTLTGTMTERLRIDSSGNIGVGTASPSVSLDLGNKSDALRLPNGTTAQEPAAALAGMIRYNTSTPGVEYYSGTAWVTIGGGGSTLTGVTSISDSTGNIALSPQSSTGAVIVNSGTPSTSSSTGAMQVTGGEGVSGAIYAGTSINAGSSVTAATSMISPQIYGSTAASGNLKLDGTSNATVGNVLLASVGGNVGVGTANPSTILHVYKGGTNAGMITVEGDGGSGQRTGLRVRPYSGLNNQSYAGFIGIDNGSSSARAAIMVPNSPTSPTDVFEAFSVLPGSGNVGIGTAAPAGALDVEGGTAATTVSGTNLKLVAQSGGTVSSGTNTSGGNILLIPGSVGTGGSGGTSGFVGIGTTSPKAALDTRGIAAAQNDNGFADFQTSAQDGLSIGYDSSNSWSWLYSRTVGSTARPMALFSTTNGASSPTMFLGTNGNVGVGTTAPGVSLDVNGGLRAGASGTVTTCGSGQANGEGTQRYNYSTHTMEFCNGTSWLVVNYQNAGTTTPVVASGPPSSSSIYTYSAANANYTPSFGSVANTENTTFVTAGSSDNGNANCVQLYGVSTTNQIVYDLGSSKLINKIYYAASGGGGDFILGATFSADGTTYAQALTDSPGGTGGYVAYKATTLGTGVTARYIRVTNAGNGSNSYSVLCNIAFGP